MKFDLILCGRESTDAIGGEVGELLIYEDPLDSVTHRKVDAWLGWKWLGRKTPGFSPS